MNILLTINCILFLKNIEYVSSERRLIDGNPVTEPKTYMVYLAQKEPKIFKDWICGGVIIHAKFILTSAACMENARKMYAVAGYEKYASDLLRDKCTMAKMKRIIYTYVPKQYRLGHWVNRDIGIAEVESPYDFTDRSYTTMCSYIPTTIPVNLDPCKEKAGTPAIILGWGHSQYLDSNGKFYPNAELLEYTSTWVMKKELCVETINNPEITIDWHIVCTMTESPKDKYRRSIAPNGAEQVYNIKRRGGSCQNDHGGPLVVWIDGVETVIGVGFTFQYSSSGECQEPSLFTSTAAFRRLIRCGIRDMFRNCMKTTRRHHGYEIVKTAVDWSNETVEIE